MIKSIAGPPNITISHHTCVSNRSVTLTAGVFLYGNSPAVSEIIWTKNGKQLDIYGSGGKFNTLSLDNQSLTIFGVNRHDAGIYQLIATNAAGSTTSDTVILGNSVQGFRMNRKFVFTF